MSAIESGNLKIAQVPFDFVELVQSIVDLSRTQCDQKKLSFKVNLSMKEEEWLIGDPLRVN